MGEDAENNHDRWRENLIRKYASPDDYSYRASIQFVDCRRFRSYLIELFFLVLSREFLVVRCPSEERTASRATRLETMQFRFFLAPSFAVSQWRWSCIVLLIRLHRSTRLCVNHHAWFLLWAMIVRFFSLSRTYQQVRYKESQESSLAVCYNSMNLFNASFSSLCDSVRTNCRRKHDSVVSPLDENLFADASNCKVTDAGVVIDTMY